MEAPLERRVREDVALVLVARGRADDAQHAARERRLQQVGGVDRLAQRAAGSHQVVKLVDEQDDGRIGGGLFDHAA
jgi:hypothetical protein